MYIKMVVFRLNYFEMYRHPRKAVDRYAVSNISYQLFHQHVVCACSVMFSVRCIPALLRNNLDKEREFEFLEFVLRICLVFLNNSKSSRFRIF